MKKILISLSIILAAAAIIASGTYAYFTDTETSTGNTFTAGTLDLKVDGKDGDAVAHFTKNNVVPAVQWYGEEYDHQWVLKNTGSVPGHVSFTIKNVKNYENNCNDPETKAGDVTCGDGTDQGELGSASQIKLLFQLNQSPWGLNKEIYPVNTSEGVEYEIPEYHLNPGENKNVYVRSWLISGPDDNLVQSDTLQFDIEFKLVQD